MEQGPTRSMVHRAIRYDRSRRRLWVGGQRLHHGLTGAVLATAGLAGFAARRMTLRGCFEATVIGTALMAHDWADRSVWFRAGPQD